MRQKRGFFFNDTATTEIYTLSLHDALPIFDVRKRRGVVARGAGACHQPIPCAARPRPSVALTSIIAWCASQRSEEHTSELQSRQYLACRLLLEKNKHIDKIKLLYREICHAS